uniref:Uncharacterized protein n=1 Tax=Solanum lycopersicum TaxID=4081 RepID=A0A494G8N7_SOLLC
MPNFFVDVRQDLFYAYGWPSRLVRPIWKHTIFGDPDSNIKNAKFFHGRPSRPCLFIRLAITACPTHLEAHDFLGDPDSDVKNAKNFRGRPSRPCLCIRLDITACPTHLEGQTSPEASIPLISTIFIATSKMPNFFVDVRQHLVYADGWPSRLARPIWKHTTIAHDFLGDLDSDVKNAKFFRGRPSRPCLCIRLTITACPTHLEAHNFLGDPDSDVKNAKFFCGRLSRPCLCIRLAITAWLTHLKGQTSPEASIPLILMIFIPTLKMPNFFVDVRPDLVYAYGWPSRLVRPIWKVKRAPKRAYPSFR